MLKITRKKNKYHAVETEKDGVTISWQTDRLVSESELQEILLCKGYDQREVHDAFFQSDPSYFAVGKW